MKISKSITVNFSGTLTLNEPQMRALEALVGYGFEPFLKCFYKEMGEHYLKPHADGLKSLFEEIKAQAPGQLYAVDEARRAIANAFKPKEPT